MIAIVLAQAASAISPILPGLEVGQSIEFVSRIDCEITSDKFDLNGALSSSRLAAPRSITFLFQTPPLDDPKAKYAPILQVVELDTSSDGSAYLLNVEARSPSGVPNASAKTQPPVMLSEGDARWMALTPHAGSDTWDYEDHRVAVHGALITEKGVCKLVGKAEAQ